MDTHGYEAWPDVFQLRVNDQPQMDVTFGEVRFQTYTRITRSTSARTSGASLARVRRTMF